MEPHTSSAVAVGESLKGAGAVTIAMVIAMTLSTLVVMCARRPKSSREWVIGIISTLVFSVCGGASLVMYFNLQHWAESYFGLMAIAGVMFSCGLPGWALVRILFNTFEEHHESTIGEVVTDVKEHIRA